MNNLLSFDVDAACAIAQASKVTFPKISMGTIDGAEMQTVNMRDLHEKLGVRTKFADWIADVLSGFTPGEDFEVFLEKEKNPSAGGRPRKEYVATLDVAKHAAMLSRTEQGKRIRQYFINAEKDLRAMQKAPVLTTNEMIAAIASNAVKMERDIAETKALTLESIERLEALESRSESIRTPQAHLTGGQEIKSRAKRRLALAHGISEAVCEDVFDYYWNQLRTGLLVANPNENARAVTPYCDIFYVKTVNDIFNRVMSEAKSVGKQFQHKSIPGLFRIKNRVAD